MTAHPDQEPGNVNRNILPERTRCPLNQAHDASCTPVIERLTRLRISGIL